MSKLLIAIDALSISHKSAGGFTVLLGLMSLLPQMCDYNFIIYTVSRDIRIVLWAFAQALPELMQPILRGCIVPAGNVEALKEKIWAYLESKLELPKPEELINYVEEQYGVRAIFPRIIEFLESWAI